MTSLNSFGPLSDSDEEVEEPQFFMGLEEVDESQQKKKGKEEREEMKRVLREEIARLKKKGKGKMKGGKFFLTDWMDALMGRRVVEH